MVAATTLRVPLQLPQRQTQRTTTITIISSILTVVPQRLPPQQQEGPQRIRPHFSLSCWPNRTEAQQAAQRLECSVHRRPLTAHPCTIIITITTTMGAMGVGVRALSSKAQGTVGRPMDAAATVAEAAA